MVDLETTWKVEATRERKSELDQGALKRAKEKTRTRSLPSSPPRVEGIPLGLGLGVGCTPIFVLTIILVWYGVRPLRWPLLARRPCLSRPHLTCRARIRASRPAVISLLPPSRLSESKQVLVKSHQVMVRSKKREDGYCWR